jgi:hypothetical protein
MKMAWGRGAAAQRVPLSGDAPAIDPEQLVAGWRP